MLGIMSLDIHPRPTACAYAILYRFINTESSPIDFKAITKSKTLTTHRHRI